MLLFWCCTLSHVVHTWDLSWTGFLQHSACCVSHRVLLSGWGLTTTWSVVDLVNIADHHSRSCTINIKMDTSVLWPITERDVQGPSRNRDIQGKSGSVKR